jgi:hypothetical protein
MNNPGRFCVNCGAALRPGSRFCESCGQPLNAAGDASVPAAAVPSILTCSTCRQSDQVVAASVYTAAADVAVKGDDNRVEPDGVAIFLEKPDKPVASGVLGWAVAPLIPAVLFFVYWFAPIHRGFKFFLFGFTVMFWVSVLVPPLSQAQLYPFIGLLHLLLYWGALFLGRDRAKVQLLTERIPAYNARLARWQHLQYCKRCQMTWLDNASAVPVNLVDVESLLAS